MSPFANHVAQSCRDALSALSLDLRSDTYAISFYVEDWEADPWRPTVTVDVNTEAQVIHAMTASEEERPGPHWIPASEHEARWNFAFWRQQPLALIADPGQDPIGSALCTSWLRSARLWVDNPTDQQWDEQGVTAAFVNLLVELAKELHSSGFIFSTFGQALPIVIHELEYYDEIADQTARANPDGQAAAFVDWVHNPR